MQSTRRTPGTNPWCALVIDNRMQQTVLAYPGRTHVSGFVPPNMIKDPVWAINTAANHFHAAGEGTMILPFTPGETGSAAYAERLDKMVQAVRAAGWKCSDTAVEKGSAWITFERAGKATVHLGITHAIVQSKSPLFDPNASAEVIAAALVRYKAAYGVPYRMTPGVCGLAKLRKIHNKPPKNGGRFIPGGRRRGAPSPHDTDTTQPWWQWKDAPEGIGGCGDLIWERPLSQPERRLQYVHTFDTNKAHLASAAQAELGWEMPEHTGAMYYDPDRAGLWRINTRRDRVGAPMASCVSSGNRMLPPWLNPARVESNGTTWVSSVAMEWLFGRRIYPEVVDSYTCSRKSRILRTWAESIRDALPTRTAGHMDDCRCPDCRYLRAGKGTFAEAIGLFAAPRALVTRADWNATIGETTRFNLLRKAETAFASAGIMPFRVKTDCLFYLTDEPDPLVFGASLGLASNIGRLRASGTWTAAEYVQMINSERKARANRRGRA